MYENDQTNETNGSYQPYQNYPYQQPSCPVKQKKSGAGKIIAIALCCSIMGGVLGAGGTYALTRLTDSTPTASSSSTIFESSRKTEALNVVNTDNDRELNAAEVYAQNVNSTVGITTSVETNFFGYRTTSPASGSGFIITEDGYIVTNYHVIEDGSSITVSTYDGKSYPAEVVGYDEENDIAVLKIDAEGLTPVLLGSSEDSHVGDSVCAIGNPLGELTFSLTSGVISALDRSVTIGGSPMNLIQTDCAINSGNSGGALFNMYGEVIGITNAKLSSSSMSEASIDNIAFAIPIDSVKTAITSIITDGTVERPYIGVTISTLGSEYQRFGLSGVVVQSVEEDSPAEEAGLKADDIITAVNGENITENNDLTAAVLKCRDGDKLTLSVNRQRDELEITVTVRVRKQSALQNDDDDDEPVEDYSDGMNGFGFFPWGFGSGSGNPM